MSHAHFDLDGEQFSARRNAFAIDVQIGGSYYLKAEASLLLSTDTGDRRIEAETATEPDLDAILALNDHPVDTIDVIDDGSVVIRLTGGERVTLLPSTDAYESWTFHSPEGLFIGMPGGGL